MEFTREEQRAIIKFFCAKVENCANIHRELVSVCGDSALDYSNVNRWMAKFKKGKSVQHRLAAPRETELISHGCQQRTCWKSHSEWSPSCCRGYRCSYGPNWWRQWWESLKKTCKWQKWVLAGCQKRSITARKKFEWPAMKKCWQDTIWSAFSGEAGHCGWDMDPPVQSRNKKSSQNNGNIQTRHPLKKIPSWRVCRENSLFNFLGPERRYSLSSPKGHDYHWRMLYTETFWRIICCLQLQKSDLNWWGPSSSIKRTLHHTRLELSQNSWWNRELRHFDILPIHLTLLRAISGCLTPWNSLSEEDNILRDQV